MRFLDYVAIFVAIVVVALVIGYSVAPQYIAESNMINNGDGIYFEKFEVKGMPCMRFGHEQRPSNMRYVYDGVSCDWSKYDGK
jgi:hypothetical protein